jgi:hypothetical protein
LQVKYSKKFAVTVPAMRSVRQTVSTPLQVKLEVCSHCSSLQVKYSKKFAVTVPAIRSV